MGDDDSTHAILVIEVIIEFLEVCLSIIFLFHLFCFIIEVKWVGTGLKFA